MRVPELHGVVFSGAEAFYRGTDLRGIQMSKRHADTEPATGEMARRLIMGFRTTQLVHIAARLGIADLLEDGPRDVSALATAVGAHPRALYRLLRALASLGVFAEMPDGRFELTPLADLLRSDAPASVRSLAMLYGDEWVWSAYGQALHSVMTGLPAFEHAHGSTFFDYLQRHPEAAASFDRGMTAYSEQEGAAVLDAYDFSGASTIVDVGGGTGALLASILRAHPRTRGVLFEQPSVMDRARDLLVHAGVIDRCTLETGSFFERVPDGGDVYLLKSILHNWDDTRSVAILRTCRAVMPDRSRLLIIERVVPDGNDPSEAKLFDINMLVMLGGLERTASEYRTILHDAGFDLIQTIETAAPVSVLESAPRQP